MNVLLLTTVFPPEVRSAAVLMGELADSLARRGHRVTVVTGSSGGPRAEGRVRVVRVPTLAVHRTRLPALIRGLGQLVNALAFLVAAASVKDVDVTLAYSPPLALGLVGAALARLRGAPHVLNVQDLVPQYAVDLGILKNGALIRLLRTVEGLVYRAVQHLTVHSRGNADYLLARGVPAGKISVVPNWVDTGLIRPASRDTSYRARHGLEGKFVVLFGGMLGFAQDLDTVVEAGAYLQSRPDVVLLIVGEGVEKDRLIAKARAAGLRNVRFMPGVSQAEYPEVVASADLCLSTLQGALKCPVVPSKLLGYMAAGRAILASVPPEGDAAGLVREARCGVCVPPGNPEALAQAILAARAEPAECLAQGERGRRFVEARHDREQVISQIEALFGELVARRLRGEGKLLTPAAQGAPSSGGEPRGIAPAKTASGG